MVNFKIGQKVKIIRTYFTDGRTEPYFHGGELKITPLEAKGTIESIESIEKIRLKLENKEYGTWGNSWTVHPTEITPLGQESLLKTTQTINW